MAYSYWGGSGGYGLRAFDEKAYCHQHMAAWEYRWNRLSGQARFLFLTEAKIAPRPPEYGERPPSAAIDAFPPEPLKELTVCGFVELRRPGPTAAARVYTAAVAHDFANRVRGLYRHRLLAPDAPGDIIAHVRFAYYPQELAEALNNVLRSVGIAEGYRAEDLVNRYVTRHRWPGWVAQALGDPLAARVLEVIRKATKPVRLADLAERVAPRNSEAARAAVDKMIAHMAVVEDLDRQTWDIVVGLLPQVRDEMDRASRPRQRPVLVTCGAPLELAPEGSLVVTDLRAVLLEVASESPQIRQDGELYQRETKRFLDALTPLSPLLAEAIGWTTEARLDHALGWAALLDYVAAVNQGKHTRLKLTDKGNKWLAGALESQYFAVFKGIRNQPSGGNHHELWGFFVGDRELRDVPGQGDSRFLGADVRVQRKGPGHRSNSPEGRSDDRLALREAIALCLAELSPGIFFELESVLAHTAFENHNPLHLGLDLKGVDVFWSYQLIPPLEEEREETGRKLLDALIRRRLIPQGALRAGLDDGGRLCVARTALFDAYFGQAVPGTSLTEGLGDGSRVVVQPDFTIVIIGLNPAPAAELLPFSERAKRGGDQGALVLKLTRNSVVKAAMHGLEPAEILDRLERHSSKPVPANVRKEVEDWCGWVRHVSTSHSVLLRCPDRETADRVAGTLKRHVERLSDTVLALDQAKLDSADRKKLREQGILLQGSKDSD